MIASLLLSLGPQALKIGTRLGVEVSDRPSAFVDLARVTRPFQLLGSEKPAPVDKNGYPTAPFWTVFMDDRPAFAWAPPMDDPAAFQPEESGTYKLVLKGQADVTASHGSPAIVTNQRYDPVKNETTADVTLPKGAPNLLILDFGNARRSPGGPPGVSALHLYRPGYPTDGSVQFTKEFLRALKPFAYLRFMGWLDTNYNAGYYGDAGHHRIEWKDRTRATDAIQGQPGLREGTHGYAWETLIDLANQTHKDMWINIPVSATGADPAETGRYVYQLASLLKQRLDPKLRIYIEHSNEVWNFGFSQYIWNKLAAVDEVQKGGSVLNADGSKDQEQWARRRHAVRLYQISKIFERVFGPGSLNSRIRPVYAAWTIQPQWYSEVLDWMAAHFGAPKNYFFALAGTLYFNDQKAHAQESPAQVLEAMRADLESAGRYTASLRDVANKFGLNLAAYEAGPDSGGGDNHNIGSRIRANRLPEMGDLVVDAFSRFFQSGGDYATYFALSSGSSRYGCWGALEDLKELDTPKYRGILRLADRNVGKMPRASDADVRPSPKGLRVKLDRSKVTLTWDAEPGATSYTVWTTEGGNFVIVRSRLEKPTWSGPVSKGRHVYYVTAEFSAVSSQPTPQVAVDVP